MAATLYNKLTGSSDADSAGTVTDNDGETLAQRATYRPAAKHVIAAMAKEGVDVSNNTRDLLTEDMLANYDKVVVMAEEETIPEFLKKSPKFVFWQVDDPKGGDYATVQKAKKLIKQKVEQMINKKA